MKEFKKTAPVVRTWREYMPEPFVDGDPAAPDYVGYAPFGVGTDEPGWSIIKYVVDGTVRQALYPRGSADFTFVWDNRASYNYGR